MGNIVYIPVPVEHLAAVYAALTEILEGSTAGIRSEARLVGPRLWDRAALDAHLVTSSDTIVGLAAYLAARPGIEVTSDEVAVALALPHGWKSLAGALGAFVRYLRNRGFEDAQGEVNLPWSITYDDRGDGRARFCMPTEAASLVQEALERRQP